MNLKQRITKVFTEGLENSKEIISTNIVNSFDDMGMAHVNPGEFAAEEITDKENLINKGEMSNDTEFNKDKKCCPMAKAAAMATDLAQDLVDISAPAEVEIQVVDDTKTLPDTEEKNNALLKSLFGESKFSKMVENILGGKTCEEYLKESDYAGPLDFVPDTRINASDVLSSVKAQLGDRAVGANIREYPDPDTNYKRFQITQIEGDLPTKLEVNGVVLKLYDDNTYMIEKIAKDFPLKK